MTAEDDLVAQLRDLVRRLNEMPDDREPTLTELGLRVQQHLGSDPSALPVTVENVSPHRLIDIDLALDDLGGDSATLLGISGGTARHHEDFASMLRSLHRGFTADAPVDYTSMADSPHTTRHVVALGLRLLHIDDHPIAVLQRAADRRFGRDTATLEVLASTPATAAAFIDRVRERANELSVVRGQVVTFGRNDYGHGVGSMTFLPRPEVSAASVVLPDGVLERVRDHVVGVAEHADELRAHGQHLKRGILLYGPPGTGKTHTVRHLLHEMPHATAVLLQGGALGAIGEAAQLARALAPAIVVLEDVDLVASERGMFGLQPLLFEVLDALDGLDGDADVAFVMTTNRADVLEPALAARPGRIDLALEIPLPGAEARRALFHLYAKGLRLSRAALDAAATDADGTTASFAKELIRRAVLRATLNGREAEDDDLRTAFTELRESTEGISRVLFGGADAAGVPQP